MNLRLSWEFQTEYLFLMKPQCIRHENILAGTSTEDINDIYSMLILTV